MWVTQTGGNHEAKARTAGVQTLPGDEAGRLASGSYSMAMKERSLTSGRRLNTKAPTNMPIRWHVTVR